jgi:hypothetical protein
MKMTFPCLRASAILKRPAATNTRSANTIETLTNIAAKFRIEVHLKKLITLPIHRISQELESFPIVFQVFDRHSASYLHLLLKRVNTKTLKVTFTKSTPKWEMV